MPVFHEVPIKMLYYVLLWMIGEQIQMQAPYFVVLAICIVLSVVKIILDVIAKIAEKLF